MRILIYYYQIKKKKLFTSAYELRKKIVVCLLRTTVECNFSTVLQQARNLGQAVEYAA